jgi:hypothetical protein
MGLAKPREVKDSRVNLRSFKCTESPIHQTVSVEREDQNTVSTNSLDKVLITVESVKRLAELCCQSHNEGGRLKIPPPWSFFPFETLHNSHLLRALLRLCRDRRYFATSLSHLSMIQLYANCDVCPTDTTNPCGYAIRNS